MIIVHVMTPSSAVLSDLKVYCGEKVTTTDPSIKLITADRIDFYILRDMVGKMARLEMPKAKDEPLEKLLRTMWALAESEGCADETLCMACANPAKEHRMILERVRG